MADAIDLNALSLPELFAHFARSGLIQRLLDIAADEDLGELDAVDKSASVPRRARGGYAGDITSEVCIDPSARGRARIMARREGVAAGLAAIPMLLRTFTTDVKAFDVLADGTPVARGTCLGTLEGPMDELLSLERTLLNLIGRMSGIATQTARYGGALRGSARACSNAKLYDTRKTTPGLRVLEKYSVRCGGGYCHRMGLFDAVLIKDNHLTGIDPAELAGVVARASSAARERVAQAGSRLQFVECEVDTLEQLRALLTLPRGVLDIVLLDNMSPAELREACMLRDKVCPWLELEASGGITLETIGAVGACGVNRISVGALTHSAVQLDVALDME